MNATNPTSTGLKINARLGLDATAQLTDLMKKTGLSMSEIMRLSLAHYHQTMLQASKPKAKSRIASMAGQYESKGKHAGTLSTNYKQLIAESLASKHSLSK